MNEAPDPRDYEIRIWYSAEKGDECFVAQVVEWPGIMAHGDTREEAARQIQVAVEVAVTRHQAARPCARARLMMQASINSVKVRGSNGALRSQPPVTPERGEGGSTFCLPPSSRRSRKRLLAKTFGVRS